MKYVVYRECSMFPLVYTVHSVHCIRPVVCSMCRVLYNRTVFSCLPLHGPGTPLGYTPPCSFVGPCVPTLCQP